MRTRNSEHHGNIVASATYLKAHGSNLLLEHVFSRLNSVPLADASVELQNREEGIARA
jgi:hypothetical protein